MSIKLRTIIFAIAVIQILAIGAWLTPRIVALSYQMRGGRQIDPILEKIRGDDQTAGPCTLTPLEEGQGKRRINQALDDLLKSARIDPGASHTYFLLGRAYCLIGDYEKAVAAYQSYTRERPKNPLGHLELGFAYEAADEDLSATEEWQAAGVTAETFFTIGEQIYKTKRVDEALRWYERATMVAADYAQAWLGMGRIYEERSEWDKAIENYRVAWEYDPELSTTALANALSYQGDFQATEDILRESLLEYPDAEDRLKWWRTLGDSLTARKEWDTAVEVYQQALSEYPDDVSLLIDLGWAMYERGDGAQIAQEQFATAIALSENVGDGYYAIAQLLQREKKYSEAEEWYLKAIERSPNKWWYLMARAQNARLNGNLVLAIQTYQEIITRFPGIVNAYYALAQTYRMNNQPKEAVQTIEKVLELMHPMDDLSYSRAGEIFEWAGERSKALAAYRQALVYNPDNENALAGVERLK